MTRRVIPVLCVTHAGPTRHDTANSQRHPEMSPVEDLLPTKGIHIFFHNNDGHFVYVTTQIVLMKIRNNNKKSET